MLSKTLILAAAATGLMAGAAFAQNAPSSYPDRAGTPPDQIQGRQSSPNTGNPAASSAQSSTNQSNASALTPTTQVSALPPGSTLTNELVTNGPVPDTRANRSQFGGPDSHAGKTTRAAGN
jgi:hypothetical protein